MQRIHTSRSLIVNLIPVRGLILQHTRWCGSNGSISRTPTCWTCLNLQTYLHILSILYNVLLSQGFHWLFDYYLTSSLSKTFTLNEAFNTMLTSVLSVKFTDVCLSHTNTHPFFINRPLILSHKHFGWNLGKVHIFGRQNVLSFDLFVPYHVH